MSDFNILIWISLFIGGYLLIYFFADVFIDNLKEICLAHDVSPFIIGLLIMGIDPEESIASIIASINGLPYIAVGNVIGNSIIALTLCFSLPVLVYKIKINKIPKFFFLVIFSCLIFIILSFLIISGLFIFGIGCLFIYLIYLMRNIRYMSKKEKSDFIIGAEELKEEVEKKELKVKAILLIVISMILIIVGGEILIYATEQLMNLTGISESLFGFVIIAFTTNVEELTLLFKSIKKHSVEIGMGGMIGKLIWNLTLTFGISGIIALTIRFDWTLIWNWLILTFLMFYYYVISWKGTMNRKDGIMLFLIFVSFLMLNILMPIKMPIELKLI